MIEIPTKALTLWPEWAFAVHHLGKRVENRTWKIPAGVWFGLHAGKSPGGRATMDAACDADMGVRAMASRAGWSFDVTAGNIKTSRVTFTDGAVRVGWNVLKSPTSTLLGIFRVTRHDAPGCGDLTGWRVPDQVGNVFEYVPLVRPMPCKGAQGLWTIPADVRALMEVSNG